jgi:hypothetical protein
LVLRLLLLLLHGKLLGIGSCLRGRHILVLCLLLLLLLELLDLYGLGLGLCQHELLLLLLLLLVVVVVVLNAVLLWQSGGHVGHAVGAAQQVDLALVRCELGLVGQLHLASLLVNGGKLLVKNFWLMGNSLEIKKINFFDFYF